MGEIGSGKFAFVNKAQWTDQKSGVCLTVAVKSLHSPASQEERVKFLQEAAIMGQFVHPNIVRLIGVVKIGDEVRVREIDIVFKLIFAYICIALTSD